MCVNVCTVAKSGTWSLHLWACKERKALSAPPGSVTPIKPDYYFSQVAGECQEILPLDGLQLDDPVLLGPTDEALVQHQNKSKPAREALSHCNLNTVGMATGNN